MASRPLRVIVSPEASADLEDILLYGIERHGVAAATNYLDGLQRAFEQLGEHPFTGQRQDFVRLGLRRLVHRSHIAYYEMTDEEVVILRIEHASRDRPTER